MLKFLLGVFMKTLNFKKIKNYIFIFATFVLLSFSKKYGYSSLALPAYIGLIYNGFPMLITFILYQLANLVIFNLYSIIIEFISCSIITIIFLNC